METKEITISTGKVVIKELTFGDDNIAIRNALAEAFLHGKQSLDVMSKREFSLLESIVEAPFPKTIEALRALKKADGQAIAAAFNDLNEVSSGE